MDDNGQNYLVFAAGTVLGALTIGLLGVNTVYQFSPVLKVAIFCLLSLFLALIGICANKPLDYSVYILSFSSFVMALNLALNVSSLDITTHLLVAALGSTAFLGAGYALQQGLISPEKSHFKVYAAIVLLALVLTAGYDLSGEQPRYNLIAHENPELGRNGDLEIGKVIVHNRFQLSRPVKLPEYRACIYNSSSLTQNSVQVKDIELIESETLRQLELSTTLDKEMAQSLKVEQMKIVKSSECMSQNATNEIRIVPPEN